MSEMEKEREIDFQKHSHSKEVLHVTDLIRNGSREAIAVQPTVKGHQNIFAICNDVSLHVVQKADLAEL